MDQWNLHTFILVMYIVYLVNFKMLLTNLKKSQEEGMGKGKRTPGGLKLNNTYMYNTPIAIILRSLNEAFLWHF